MDPLIRGPTDTWTHWYVDPLIHGPTDTWTHWYMDPLIHGPTDTWKTLRWWKWKSWVISSSSMAYITYYHIPVLCLSHQYSSYSTGSSVGVWYDECDTTSVIRRVWYDECDTMQILWGKKCWKFILVTFCLWTQKKWKKKCWHLEILFWKFEILFWKLFFGNYFLEVLFWKFFFGNNFLKIIFWKLFFGNYFCFATTRHTEHCALLVAFDNSSRRQFVKVKSDSMCLYNIYGSDRYGRNFYYVVVYDKKIITWVTLWYDFIKLVLVWYHSLARSSLVRDIAPPLVW